MYKNRMNKPLVLLEPFQQIYKVTSNQQKLSYQAYLPKEHTQTSNFKSF
jgi:hypothetical protein